MAHHVIAPDRTPSDTAVAFGAAVAYQLEGPDATGPDRTPSDTAVAFGAAVAYQLKGPDALDLMKLRRIMIRLLQLELRWHTCWLQTGLHLTQLCV